MHVMLNLFQHPLFFLGIAGLLNLIQYRNDAVWLLVFLTPVKIMRMQKFMRQMSARFAEIFFVYSGDGRIEVRLAERLAFVFGVDGEVQHRQNLHSAAILFISQRFFCKFISLFVLLQKKMQIEK